MVENQVQPQHQVQVIQEIQGHFQGAIKMEDNNKQSNLTEEGKQVSIKMLEEAKLKGPSPQGGKAPTPPHSKPNSP